MKEAYRSLLEGRRSALRGELEPILATSPEFVCEIGSGHGHFLTAYAAAHPERLCVGLDLVSERVERAVRKRDRARLPNLHFLRTEARLFFEILPSHARISTLFLLFPDPWPKARHQKHRIVQPDFLTTLSRFATPQCRLCFRTDYAPYFADAEATIRLHPGWQLVTEPWPFEYATVFQQRAETFASLMAAPRPCPTQNRDGAGATPGGG